MFIRGIKDYRDIIEEAKSRVWVIFAVVTSRNPLWPGTQQFGFLFVQSKLVENQIFLGIVHRRFCRSNNFKAQWIIS